MGANSMPMRIMMTVDKSVMVREEKPLIGWFDEASDSWTREDVTDVVYDPDTRRLAFTTLHLTHLAMLHVRENVLIMMECAFWTCLSCLYTGAHL